MKRLLRNSSQTQRLNGLIQQFTSTFLKLMNPYFWLGLFTTIAIILTAISPATALTKILELTATYESGTTSTYQANGNDTTTTNPTYPATTQYTLSFGQGSPKNNLRISGFTTASDTFSLLRNVSKIGIRRKDGAVTGIRQLLFYETNNFSSPNLKLAPSEVDVMETALLNTIINRGTDNVFTNTVNTNGNNNNIERIDFLESPGLTAPTTGLADVGFLIMERNGNDPFQIAAITGINSSGNPTAFGNLIKATSAQWGQSSLHKIPTSVMRKDPSDTNLRPSTNVGIQALSGIYFSYTDLGITAGQKFYGYALFPNDVSTANDLVNLTDFPINTTEANGGMDLVAGGGIYIKNTATKADLALQKTVDNTKPATGATITFTVKVTNETASSTSSATGVKVQDSLPTGLQYLSSTPSSGTYDPVTGIWNVGSIARGSSASLQITAKVTGSGSIINTAQVSASDQIDPDSIPNNNNPSEDDQSSVSITVTDPPNLRLVKRITGIRKANTPITTPPTTVNGYHDLLTDPNDNAPGWVGGSAAYLQGAFTSSQIPTPDPGVPTPGGEVEYTIYFLSDGAGTAQNASICDFIPEHQSYVVGTMQLNFNGATTAIAEGSGTGPGSGFYTTNFPTSCQGTNNNKGAAYFQIGNVTSVNTTPASSYGFVRFRAKVD